MGSYLSIEFVKNVFEVVTLDTLFGVEKFEKLLHELGCHVHFEGTHLNWLIYYQLQEKFVDSLQVGPRGVHFFFLINSCLRKAQVRFFNVGERTENILGDHIHDLVQVRNNDAHHIFLVLQHLLQLRDGIQTFSL